MSFESISVVVPVFDEQASLPELIGRCRTVGRRLGCRFELILVDDGSSDDSPSIIRAAAKTHSNVIGVLLKRNVGQHSAVMAGLAQAAGDVVVTLDADLQNPPEEIPKVLELIESGYDVAGGVRIRRRDPMIRILISRAMNAGMRKLTGLTVGDYGCMLRAYRRDVVDAMLQCPERSTFVPALANAFASNIGEAAVRQDERRAGQSKYGFFKLCSLYFDLLVTSTLTPLRVLSVLGAAFAALGIGFGALLLALRLIYGASWAAEGVITIFGVLFAFLGVQLIALGLLGEYIGRICRDVQGRPRYLVKELVGTTTSSSHQAPDFDTERTAHWEPSQEAKTS